MYKNLRPILLKSLVLLALLIIITVIFNSESINDDVQTNVGTSEIRNLPKHKYKLSGKVKLSDGDSLKFTRDKNRARLFGIDSPELAQTCIKNSKKWQCGRAAKKALYQKIAQRSLTCIGDDYDKHRRLIATCYLYTGRSKTYENLNAWMVKNGWAIAYVYYSNRYSSQQQFAKQNKLGIWQGTFMEPFKWRKKNLRK